MASSLDPGARICNESMVNAGESGICHKAHCKDKRPSPTGDALGHCQTCEKFNTTDKAAGLVHPVLALKYKKPLLSALGLTAVSQVIILMIVSLCMVVMSVLLIVSMYLALFEYNSTCGDTYSVTDKPGYCSQPVAEYRNKIFGAWGGFNSSAYLSTLAPDSLASEQASFLISNGAQVLYSMLYLLLIYNITLIIMEFEWGKYEKTRRRLRCTIVKGDAFDESYFFQLPPRAVYPAMASSALMHWLLGQPSRPRRLSGSIRQPAKHIPHIT